MKFTKDFFIDLGFDFKIDLKSTKINFVEDSSLNNKLQNTFFFYSSPNQTNTSFYLITTQLSDDELITVRKYIWNQNEANLLFYIPNKNILKLLDAKTAPNKKAIELDTFKATEKDLKKIERIKKWRFDSGTFWINYYDQVKKAKHKSVDKILINTLKNLKSELEKQLSKIESDINKKDEVVQALIDRTLYVKYLEDNHIINSYFRKRYFGNEAIDYKTLLSSVDVKSISRLFEIIHKIFNNGLFHPDTIDEKYLTTDVCHAIETSLNRNLKSNQISLFDFQFDVIPVEFISYIYEIFLTKDQKDNGIYYTPKKLAQLIVDDVIVDNKVGKVLDPACGSGMFLIVAFQKLLEISNEPENIADKIEFRTKLLADNIFGIEKQIIAQRFTLFSLSLQLFRNLDFEEVRDYIANQLKQNKEITLFKKYSFFDNIICDNSLQLEKSPFDNKTFNYVVGNPPFFEIKQNDEEISFINDYKSSINDETLKAKEIVGNHQISQCFLLKIKDWSSQNTRFGFVSNSSNFYNDNSKNFQAFFYSHYKIEKIYELSRVKKILFEKASESVVSLIFSNETSKTNFIEYYPVDLGIFSQKPFNLLIVQEDKIIKIEQADLFNKVIRLRDFLIGNKFDEKLINTILKNDKLESYIYKNSQNKNFIHRGIEIVGFEEVLKEFDIPKTIWLSFSKETKKDFFTKFKNKYSKKIRSSKFNTPFIKTRNIVPFSILFHESYMGNISMFHRPRTEEIFTGKKIIWSRIGNFIKAIYNENKIFFDFDLYVLKLKNDNLYHFVTAILNSDLSNYYVNLSLKKRINSSFSKIGIEDIKKIPIPKNLDENLVNQISEISKDLTKRKYAYEGKVVEELNDLIFDLYDLSYLEKQRIKDYFLPKNAKTTPQFLEQYKSAFLDTVSIYLQNPIDIESYKADFGLIVVKVLLNKNNSDTPSSKKVAYFELSEIFEQNPTENFIASTEKIFGKDCLYIIKKDVKPNWSETKAYEDGQELLKLLN